MDLTQRAPMRTRPVVVTGAAGFIGRALCAHFARIRARRFARSCARAGPPIDPRRRDVVAVRDLATATEAELDAIVAGAAAVVHLAGRAHVHARNVTRSGGGVSRANVVATARLARAAVRAGVRRFVFASTVKVNGEATRPGHPFAPTIRPRRTMRMRGASSRPSARSRVCAGHGDDADRPAAAARLRSRRRGQFPGAARRDRARARRCRSARSATGAACSTSAISSRRSTRAARCDRGAARACTSSPTARACRCRISCARSPAALGVAARLLRGSGAAARFAGRLIGRRARSSASSDSLEVDRRRSRAATGWQPRHSLAAGLAGDRAMVAVRHSI